MTVIEKAKWNSILDSENGRFVLLQVLELCRVDLASFGETDRITSFNEGKRAVGLALLSRIDTADPYGRMKLLKQETEDGERTRIERERNPGSNASGGFHRAVVRTDGNGGSTITRG